jgi:hypothetical protein
MASAKVTLVQGPLTFSVGTVNFTRGKQITVTDPALLERLKHNRNFAIELPAKEKSVAKKASKPVKPVEEDEAEDVEEESEDEDAEDEAPKVPTRSDLKKLNKNALSELGVKLGLAFAEDASKNVMIDEILEASDGDEG